MKDWEMGFLDEHKIKPIAIVKLFICIVHWLHTRKNTSEPRRILSQRYLFW